jgi:hypothetical protein
MVPISDPFGSVDFSEERASMIIELYLRLTKFNSNNSNILIMTHQNFTDELSIVIMFLSLFCFSFFSKKKKRKIAKGHLIPAIQEMKQF